MHTHIILTLISLLLSLLLLYAAYLHLRRRRWRRHQPSPEDPDRGPSVESVGLIQFPGGEDLTVQNILEAPGEVVVKSNHGTLYRASLLRRGAATAALLRFVRPECAGRIEDILPVVRALGLARHPNVVPIHGMYVGPRGEKLLVSPFYAAGSLSGYLQDWNAASHRWEVTHKLALGIARGLEYLHNGLNRPIIHGNLKMKNILLDANNQPRLSDFGLHLILNPMATHEMLEASRAEGYKAPELLKMKDSNKETDVYSLGVIFLKMVTPNGRNEVVSRNKEYSPPTKDGRSLMLFQLAIDCCSPSPALRPNAKQVVRKLEEIGW